MNTILLILTGGTIGSEKKRNIVNISKNSFLQYFLKKRTGKNINFKIVQPINILSENAIPDDWNNIIECIEKNWSDKFAGIIITHGTDTLSFASSAISQYFYNFYKPIIIVSSDKPIKDKNATGKFNLEAAINFIIKQKLPGTYVSYKNPKENYVTFFLGSRVKQINSYDNTLKTIDGGIICNYKKKFIFLKKKNLNIDSIKKNNLSCKLNNKYRFSNKILIINPYPGLNYDIYSFNKIKPKAILHTLYHSGTTSTRNDSNKSFSLEKFIKKNNFRKIPFFIAPISGKNKNIYASLKKLMNLNIKFLDSITFETAYAKLALAYKSFNNNEEINNFILKNNFFEKSSF